MITRALSDSYSTHSPAQHSLSLADEAFEFRNFHLRTNWWPLRELPTIPLHPFQRYGQTAINHSFAPSNWAQLSIYWQWELLTLGCDDFTLCQRRLWPCQRALSFHCECPPSKPVQTLQKKIKKNTTLQTQVAWVAEIAWRSAHWKLASAPTAFTTEPSLLEQEVEFTFKATASWTFLLFIATTSIWTI